MKQTVIFSNKQGGQQMLLINISPEEFSFYKLLYHPTNASRPLGKAEHQGIANTEHSLCMLCSGVSEV